MVDITNLGIIEEFAFYQDEDYFYQNIPEQKLRYINKKYRIPAGETIIAFLHCRFNRGICLTEKGAYWKLFGQGQGSLSWELLKDVTDIKVEKDKLYLDNKVVIDLGGTTYPQKLFVELFDTIKENSIKNPDYFSKINNNNNPQRIEDIHRICSTFKGDNDCLVCNILNVDIKTEDSLSEKFRKSLRSKNNLREEDTIIAYVNTYMGIGTNGVVITDKGVCISKEFLSLYYPWHIFKQISFVYNEQEKMLIINDRNEINLSCSIIDGKDILLFLQQLQKQV